MRGRGRRMVRDIYAHTHIAIRTFTAGAPGDVFFLSSQDNIVRDSTVYIKTHGKTFSTTFTENSRQKSDTATQKHILSHHTHKSFVCMCACAATLKQPTVREPAPKEKGANTCRAN